MEDMANIEAPELKHDEGLKTTADAILLWSKLKIQQYPDFLGNQGAGAPFIDEYRGFAKLSCETDLNTHVIELTDPEYSTEQENEDITLPNIRSGHELIIRHTTIPKNSLNNKTTDVFHMISGKLRTKNDANSSEVPKPKQEEFRRVLIASHLIRP